MDFKTCYADRCIARRFYPDGSFIRHCINEKGTGYIEFFTPAGFNAWGKPIVLPEESNYSNFLKGIDFAGESKYMPSRIMEIELITVEKLEGAAGTTGFVYKGNLFNDASRALALASRTSPEKGQGYDKCSVIVEYKPWFGVTFSFRFRVDINCNEMIDLTREALEIAAFRSGVNKGAFTAQEYKDFSAANPMPLDEILYNADFGDWNSSADHYAAKLALRKSNPDELYRIMEMHTDREVK